MTAVEYILNGLEAELTLERELGVRVFECDRELLKVETPKASTLWELHAPIVEPIQDQREMPIAAKACDYDFVFLHHCELPPNCAQMLTRITSFLGKDAKSAPLLLEPPLPKARVYIVLGGKALQKFFPELEGAPGMWLAGGHGEQVLVTYSPKYVLRFGETAPSVRPMKEEMLKSFKVMLQRLALG